MIGALWRHRDRRAIAKLPFAELVRLPRIVAAVLLLALAATVALQPPLVQNVEHWARYRLTGYVPPPIVAGRNGRLFLGNHESGPPLSLIRTVCGDGVGDDVVPRAVASVRTVLQAGAATGVPFRFLIVPTAPRIYPEDVPPGMRCDQFPTDRLVLALQDRTVVYPVDLMAELKKRFDVLPRRHFHWAGEGPLRVAEAVADSMGLAQAIKLPLRLDNRSSDLNGFYPGMGVHDRIQTPNLKAASVAQCTGEGCHPPIPAAIVAFTRPGPGRLLVIADSFGDEIGGDFSEFAGTTWLVRMNLALEAPGPVSQAIERFHPDAIVVIYHDAGALALDAPAQSSLALTAQFLRDLRLPTTRQSP